MSDDKPFEIYEKAEFEDAFVVAAWNEDAAGLGSGVAGFLTEKMHADEFGRMDPSEFFPLSGVAIEDDVAQFPEGRFFHCNDRLAVFASNPPRSEWHRFLNTLMDVGHDYCHVKEMYVIGGMVSLAAHTSQRHTLCVANTPEMKDILRQYGMAGSIDFETPPGQRPTLNSYFLWVARKRGILATTIWVPVPFYLVSHEDPQSVKRILEFFSVRMDLGLDFSDLDDDIARQNELLTEARHKMSDVDGYIRRLENDISLTEEESEKLVKELDEFLWSRE